MMLSFSAPANADAAVVLACDANYLPYTLHLAYQMVLAHPGRNFDILVASEAPLSLPDWAAEAGVTNFVPPDFTRAGRLALHHLTRSTYLCLFLPDALADRYRRVLYLDSDIYLEAGGLDRLMRLDLGPHAVGAVQDIDSLLDATHHAPEYRAIGEPAHAYLNAGVLLFDTQAWRAARLLDRCLTLALEKPAVQVKHDQSLLNGALLGQFAELSPVWNWMCNQRFPLLTRSYPVRVRHFIGGTKPWRDPTGRHDARFAAAYAAFFHRTMPEALDKMRVAAPGLRLMPIDAMARLVLDQHRMRKRLTSELARFRDDWDVKHRAGAK